jgi:hypothetical protein
VHRLEERLARIDPAVRRRFALWLLVVSLVLGHVNIGAFAFGLVSPALMDAITNYLSWLAITITALDLVATADVRAEGPS